MRATYLKVTSLRNSLAMLTVTTVVSFGQTPNVVAWGWDGRGQTNVPADLTDAKAIAAGSYHSIALKRDGTVVSWGDGWLEFPGVLAVPSGLKDVKAIAAGGGHNLALRTDGTVVAWGMNEYGQSSVPTGLNNVVAIAAGYYHSLALKADGTLVEWGYAVPTWPEDSPTNVAAIADAYAHSVALLKNGTVIAFGNTGANQTAVPEGLTGVVAISASGNNSLALKADGTVVGWGGSPPFPIPSDLGRVVAIASGESHSLAVKSDTTVAAWDNGTGADTRAQIAVPPGLSGVIAVAGGGEHSLALLATPDLLSDRISSLPGLSSGQQKALQQSLTSNGPVCVRTETFIKQVTAFVKAKALTSAEAQTLINYANAIKAQNDCGA